MNLVFHIILDLKLKGKKITWVDGLKSFYYLIKVRFFDNSSSTNLSILYSSIYMAFVGSHFGMGLGNTFIYNYFFYFGSIFGIHFKILSSTIIFFLYLLDHYLVKVMEQLYQ